MAIRTYDQRTVIYGNNIPCIRKMATGTGSRIMIIRAGMAGAAITQCVVEDSIAPGGCVMAGTALRGKTLFLMICWWLMTGLAISLGTVIHCYISPGTGGVTLTAVSLEMSWRWFIICMAGQAGSETSMINGYILPI